MTLTEAPRAARVLRRRVVPSLIHSASPLPSRGNLSSAYPAYPPVPSLELIRQLAWKADGMQVDGLPPALRGPDP